MFRKDLAFLATISLLLVSSAIPVQAGVNVLYTATVDATCDKFTITVTGCTSKSQSTINYMITITPASGTPLTISDSVAVGTTGNFTFTASKAFPACLGDVTLTGTATLQCGSTSFSTLALTFLNNGSCTNGKLHCPCTPPPPNCVGVSTNTSDFNGTAIGSGAYIWFNANFTASGIPRSGATITFQNSTIQFTANQTYNLHVPNAQITFSPSATCASTSFNTLTNTWVTTVPLGGNDEIFLSGLAFNVPNTLGKVNGQVLWQGTFSSTAPAVSLQWKWGAAVYTRFTTDYNVLAVKDTHSQSCVYINSDHAGTPEGFDSASSKPFKKFVTGGARGGGGSNFTGSWSGTQKVKFTCP